MLPAFVSGMIINDILYEILWANASTIGCCDDYLWARSICKLYSRWITSNSKNIECSQAQEQM
jgi:hypothetical protein